MIYVTFNLSKNVFGIRVMIKVNLGTFVLSLLYLFFFPVRSLVFTKLGGSGTTLFENTENRK